MSGGEVSRGQQLRWFAGIFAVAVALVLRGDDPDQHARERATAEERVAKAGPGGGDPKCRFTAGPAEIVANPDPVSDSSIDPVSSEWRVTTGRWTVTVMAGSYSQDPSRETGFIGLYRIDLCHSRPAPRATMTLPDSGQIEITDAPLGRDVTGRDGEVRFTSEFGTTGTVHLADDSITVD